MSISDSTVKGKGNEILGNIKQGIGEAVGNDRLANEGAAEQVKGHGQQAWGSVKEGFRDATGTSSTHTVNPDAVDSSYEREGEAHHARNSVTNAAESVKDSIERGIDHLTGKR